MKIFFLFKQLPHSYVHFWTRMVSKLWEHSSISLYYYLSFKCSLLTTSVVIYQSNVDVSKRRVTIYGPHAFFRRRNREVPHGHKGQVQTCDCTRTKEKSAWKRVALLNLCAQLPYISQTYKCCKWLTWLRFLLPI